MAKKIELDASPSGEEEAEAFIDLKTARGDPYDESKAKLRIDNIARKLVFWWTLLLAYIIFAQGHAIGYHPRFWGRFWPLLPVFHLGTSEFIAVVTTTTTAVFGFLVIIATNLFKKT